MGIAGVLTVIFVVLKVLGIITWSWLWVLSPLWIGLLLTVVLIGVYALGVRSATKRFFSR